MIVNVKELRTAQIEFEKDKNPPPPPPGGTPPPPSGPDEDDPYIDITEPPDVEVSPGGDSGGHDSPGVGGGDGPLKPELDDTPGEGAGWKQAVEEALSRNKGSMPAGLARFIEELLNPPQVNWKEKLRRFANAIGTKRSYKLPNRRFLGQGKVLWGSKKELSDIDTAVIISDTSGSMSQEEILQHMSEAAMIVNELKPLKTYILFCDSRLYEDAIVVFKRGERFKVPKPQGGGGTSFVPPFEWIEKNVLEKREKLGPVVYFTDGYGDFPNTEDYRISTYEKNVFWVITGKGSPNKDIKVPFGERADMIL